MLDFGKLTVLFVGLKLTGKIAWPWWKVIMPTLIEAGARGLFAVWKTRRTERSEP